MKKNLLLELVCLFGTVFHILLKLSTLIFVKTIKSLLINALDNEGNYLNVTYSLEYFKNLTWYVVYTFSCNLSFFCFVFLFQIKKLCAWVGARGFSFCVLLYLFSFFLICNSVTSLFIIFVLPRLALLLFAEHKVLYAIWILNKIHCCCASVQ